jgi:lysophospholipid acyltransferase (LPLAT)-like uncharacterized protein
MTRHRVDDIPSGAREAGLGSTFAAAEEGHPRTRTASSPPRRCGWALRVKLWLVAHTGTWAIRLLGRTLRWQVDGMEHHRAASAGGRRIIYVVWHGRIFMAVYFWRDRGIVVMTSRNTDGEYIARVIRRFGYGAARGSSSRGGRAAVAEMARELRSGRDVGYTIDGPRGPRYVAKPGAVWIAARTGSAILPFHISAERRWVLRSWDQFQIPKPFSRARVLIAPPIEVPRDAGEPELAAAQRRLQQTLDELRERGDATWQADGPR